MKVISILTSVYYSTSINPFGNIEHLVLTITDDILIDISTHNPNIEVICLGIEAWNVTVKSVLQLCKNCSKLKLIGGNNFDEQVLGIFRENGVSVLSVSVDGWVYL